MDAVFVVNPRSGRGKGARVAKDLPQLLAARGWTARVVTTGAPREAVEIARRASNEAPCVVAVGGDGTAHEVVNGLAQANGRAKLGIIPVGSGNDLASALGIPTTIDAALDVLMRGRTLRIDLARFDDRWFANSLGLGFEAQVTLESMRIRKLRGFAIYLWALAKAFRHLRCPHLVVRTDAGTFEGRKLLVSVGNGPRVGGGFRLTPAASLTDGLLDVCIVDAMSHWNVLRTLPGSIQGTHVHHPAVTMLRTKSLTIESPDGFPFHADGEIIDVHRNSLVDRDRSKCARSDTLFNMRWASALSTNPDLEKACAECAQILERNLDGFAPDILLVFPSREHALEQGRIPEFLAERFSTALLLGCTAGGVIGGGREIENHSALSLIAGKMPGVHMHPFRIEPGPLPSLDESPRTWRSAIGLHDAPDNLHFFLFADPFSTSADVLLKGLDYAYPNAPKLGGLASAASAPGGNALYLAERVHADGAVGVAIWGEVRIDPVVAQGGIPIGKPVQVTRCDRQVIYELDGKPALEVFQEAVEALEIELEKGQAGAFVLGIQADSLAESPRAGDFLIRNVLGIDPKANAIAIAAVVEAGQTVQFHLVGADSAALELRQLLTRYRERESAPPAGALLFSCNGRGTNLYGSPDHDSNLFHEIVGREVPLAGFFCAGEIGPVAGQTYVHGMTSSFGIIRPASSQNPAPRVAEAAQRILIPRESRRG